MKEFTIVAVIAVGIGLHWGLTTWISRGQTGVQILAREGLTFVGFLALFGCGYFLGGQKHDGLVVGLVVAASLIVWRAIQLIRLLRMKK